MRDGSSQNSSLVATLLFPTTNLHGFDNLSTYMEIREHMLNIPRTLNMDLGDSICTQVQRGSLQLMVNVLVKHNSNF